MRLSNRLVIGFVVSATSLSAQAQVQKVKNGYMFNVKYTKGQVIKYDMSMVSPATSKAVNVQVVTKCLAVDGNGVGTIQVTTPTGPKTKPNVRTSKTDRHGKPVGTAFEGFTGTFMWPDKPIKVGQSWKGDMNLGEANMGKGSMKGTYKFEGLKTLNGKQVAAVRTFLDVTGEFNVAGSGVIYVQVSDGQLHSAIFNLGMAQYNEGGSPTVLKLQMNIRAHG